MLAKKLKYIQYLEKIPDCPCATKYQEKNMEAYRWVKNKIGINDFIPKSLTSVPPQRILDDSDKHCMSYGLSMFLTLKHAAERYKSSVQRVRAHLRSQQIEEYGREIAHLKLYKDDGLAGVCESDSGHFTFHPYKNAILPDRIIQIFNIFDENGEFIIY